MTLTCEDLLQYLSEYLDNNLSDPLIIAAQEHLKTCESCRVVLNTTQQSIFLVHTYGTRIIPSDRRDKLWQQLEAAFLNCDNNTQTDLVHKEG